jgi:hypothetical protein
MSQSEHNPNVTGGRYKINRYDFNTYPIFKLDINAMKRMILFTASLMAQLLLFPWSTRASELDDLWFKLEPKVPNDLRISNEYPGIWHAASRFGLRGVLTWKSDAILARITKDEDEVFFVAMGNPVNLHNNALFSPIGDEALLFESDGLRMTFLESNEFEVKVQIETDGPLTIESLKDYYRKTLDLQWYKPLNKLVYDRPFSGWCSWYDFNQNVNEEKIISNTDWIEKNLKKFGCEWVQIDDGWQGRGSGYGTNRNWFVTCGEKFPNGMKFLADYIKSKGLKPGIWCIPYTQSDTMLYKLKPGIFVRKLDGSSPGERKTPMNYDWMYPYNERYFEWEGRYYIDPTGPEGEDYLKSLFKMLTKDWGYEYLKIDAQGYMVNVYSANRPFLRDPSFSGEFAYRKALEITRNAVEKGTYILNCHQGWESPGLCDAIRIGDDVSASWDGMQVSIDRTFNKLYLNSIVWFTDPDAILVRPENQNGSTLTMEYAKMWVTLMSITGQMFMASDDMTKLPEERVELLRRAMPVAKIRPVELYPVHSRKNIIDLKIQRADLGQWDVVGLFNWNRDSAITLSLPPSKLGNIAESNGWIYFDFWDKKLIEPEPETYGIRLEKGSCRLISIHPKLGRPQLISTSRHITQGAEDLISLNWNTMKSSIAGKSKVVSDDPYFLYFFVPDGWNMQHGEKLGNRLYRYSIHSHESRDVDWEVTFDRVN